MASAKISFSPPKGMFLRNRTITCFIDGVESYTFGRFRRSMKHVSSSKEFRAKGTWGKTTYDLLTASPLVITEDKYRRFEFDGEIATEDWTNGFQRRLIVGKYMYSFDPFTDDVDFELESPVIDLRKILIGFYVFCGLLGSSHTT